MRNRDYYRCEGESITGLITGLILGGVVGAGIVLYLHSDKGREKVKELKSRTMDYKDEIEKKFEELKEKKVYPAIESIKSEFKDRIKRLDPAEKKSSGRRRYNQ
ncbi:YtxH domain-containing protein [Candidatus Dojkabacteria bacterium]|nr:YtxH domain-containing protein [Candidatus Dojkabacteria bacterium]